jgi:cation-transporting ATPase F
VKMTELRERSDAAHHGLPIHEVVLLWGSDLTSGLTAAEVAERQVRFGPNTLPESGGPGPLRVFAEQFNSPLIYVLLGAAIVTGAIGEWIDTGVILGVVIVNAVVGYIQERRAGKALAALAELTRTRAVVIRDGRRHHIDSMELVPGDLVVIEAGDKVPADLRLASANECRVDESALTGESVPVDKSQTLLDDATTLADRTNMAYSSTLVTAGNATGVVVATGVETEIGRIHELVGSAAGVATPLTRKLARFSVWLTAIILGLSALIFILGLIRGTDIAELVTSVVAIAVAMIPEGLPAVVTVTLAIGVSRMAKRNAIIRKLPAVETLGSTTVICTDKTGTLTLNRMTVQFIYTQGRVIDLDRHDPADAFACVHAGLLCNNATSEVGDPTEMALVHVADRLGLDQSHWRERWPRRDEIPFDSALRYMATLHEESSGDTTILLKGATEEVVALCGYELLDGDDTSALHADRIMTQVEDFAGQALRVLAFASARIPAGTRFADISLTDIPFTFLGLQAMADPPRPEAVQAIRVCHEAGIAVKMITGDHVLTARAIAAKIGLTKDPTAEPQVLSGVDVTELDDAELTERIENVDVFARVSAEQKLRIVRALQARHHVVAMTGDGINDAPALKQADIGIAMGASGTEVAKEASAMVLTDDNFASIEAAVEEGRSVFANLIKFITFALPTNVGQGLIIITAVIAGVALPILPVQILWVNMTVAVALGLTLAFEPTEPSTMQMPPRPPRQSILTRAIGFRVLLVGTLMLAGAFWVFDLTLSNGDSIELARTVAVNAVIAMQIGYLFNCRSLDHSVFSVGFFSNRTLLIGVGIMIALQLAFTYVPIMQVIFQTAPMTGQQWLLVAGLGVCVPIIVGAEKFITARIRR